MTADRKALLKILIGAAWLDGRIQIEESQYLQKVAQKAGLANDPEVYPLLNELRAVTPAECYRWIGDYLGDHPTADSCRNLIEEISGLVYSDGAIANEEAQLLTKLQNLELTCDVNGRCSGNVLDVIRRLYHRWVAVVEGH
ncbi:MAG: TerB family tellurite resistance protein [Synechococcales bacterium]|nr:TerB family tellurite resistance protein [Synechococcales bacterium]